MKRTILATAVAIMLTGCVTAPTQVAYYEAVAAREKRQAEQELRADTAITNMAATGDAQAKGMAIMYFGLKSAGSKASQQMIAAPKSTAEQILPWASLLVPALTQLYHIDKTTEVQINNSDNALAAQKSNNHLIQNIVVPPVVGTQGDVLLFPN
jgi:hypothetical protein